MSVWRFLAIFLPGYIGMLALSTSTILLLSQGPGRGYPELVLALVGMIGLAICTTLAEKRP